MLENNLVLKNFSCIDDPELAESEGGIGVVATGVIIGSLTVFMSGVFTGFTDGMKEEKTTPAV